MTDNTDRDVLRAALSREAVEATPRKRLTIAQRNILLSRQHWRCEKCGVSLVQRDAPATIDEHIVPLDLGGSNDLSNRAIYCLPCAKAKTTIDRKRIAKAARIRRKLSGDERPKRKIKSRGFARDPLSWRE